MIRRKFVSPISAFIEEVFPAKGIHRSHFIRDFRARKAKAIVCDGTWGSERVVSTLQPREGNLRLRSCDFGAEGRIGLPSIDQRMCLRRTAPPCVRIESRVSN